MTVAIAVVVSSPRILDSVAMGLPVAGLKTCRGDGVIGVQELCGKSEGRVRAEAVDSMAMGMPS